MQALRRIIRGALLVAVAAGFSLVPAAPAAAETSAAAVADFCPFESGWYLIYDENDELIGVMHVDDDCNAQIW
jgi:hypothetical protein